MANFRFAYRRGGENGAANPKEYYIASATVIEHGEAVLFTPGTGIAAVAGTDFDDPFLGIAAEAHDGSTSGRQSGTAIKVYDDPGDVFVLKPSTALTLTGGSTTTAVDSSLLPATDNVFKNGYIEIASCAADSSLVGRRVKISASTGATGTLTLAETLPAALAAADTIYLYPGKLAIGEYGWDLNSDGTDVDFHTSGGEALVLVDADPSRGLSYWAARLHQFGNDAAAK